MTDYRNFTTDNEYNLESPEHDNNRAQMNINKHLTVKTSFDDIIIPNNKMMNNSKCKKCFLIFKTFNNKHNICMACCSMVRIKENNIPTNGNVYHDDFSDVHEEFEAYLSINMNGNCLDIYKIYIEKIRNIFIG